MDALAAISHLCRAWIEWMSRLVPGRRRAAWRQEWRSEIDSFCIERSQVQGAPQQLLRYSMGAAADALWIRREEWRSDPMKTDFGFALRQLRKRPGFTFVAVLVLALGIGANTAIFSVVNGVLLRSLPFKDSERLVMFYETNPERGWTHAEAAAANYLDWQERMDSMEQIGASNSYSLDTTLTGRGEPVSLNVRGVTAEYFEVLGVQPEMGRLFRAEETWAGSEKAAILSHGFWMQYLGGDRSALGSRIQLDRTPVTIVGIMPPGFKFPTPETDLWTPVDWNPASRTAIWFRRAHGLRAIGRLKEGVNIASARQELNAVAAQLSKEYPETNAQMGAGLMPLQEWLVGDARQPLFVLFGAVGFVLLIACANIANLLLARGTSRAQELAVRSALGAGRWRLVRQLLIESLLLSLGGGGLGLLLGIWGSSLLLRLSPVEVPRIQPISFDWTVFMFLVAVSLGTALLFGLLPALEASRVSLSQSLSSRGLLRGLKQRWTRNFLVVGEVALALVLVAGAGLLVRSFLNLTQVDPGFDPSRLATFRLLLPRAQYQGPSVDNFFTELMERLRALPDVEKVSATSSLPLSERGWSGDFAIKGRGREEYGVGFRHKGVYPGYFETLGVPLVAGRDFEQRDRVGTEPVTVVNRALARRFFPNQDPIGRQLTLDRYASEDSVWMTIVGVVEDEKRSTLKEEPLMFIYQSLRQRPGRSLSLALRVVGEPAGVMPAARAIVHDLDPNLALEEVATMEGLLQTSLDEDRFFMSLLGGFALTALFLAAVGIHSLLAYSVRQRSHELGVRMAVGADRRAVRLLVVRQGMSLALIGMAFGLAGAVLTTRLLDTLLFRVGPNDPVTLAGVASLLLAVSWLACYLPARRATRVDPMIALRTD